MLSHIRQSLRESTHLPNHVNRKVFKAVDPYIQKKDYFLKPKNLHYRHKSQPIEEEYIKNQRQDIVQSFQQVLRKARQKASHMRLASQTSDTWNRPSKTPKRLQFQYNKWYIDPSFRLKRPFEFDKSKTQRISTIAVTDFQENRSSFTKLRQSLQVQTTNTHTQRPQQQDKRETFIKEFAQKDYKNLALLKQFKRKQAARKCRTPELVQMILQSHKNQKQPKILLNNKSIKTVKPSRLSQQKIDDWCIESTACSKFTIEDCQVIKREKCKKGGFMKGKKRLTLLETEYAKIKENIHREIEEKKKTSDGLRVERFRVGL